jgi:hypothetical protein
MIDEALATDGLLYSKDALERHPPSRDDIGVSDGPS